MSLLEDLDDFVNRSKTSVGWLEPHELLEYADKLIAKSANEIRTMPKRTINFDDGPNGTPPKGPQTMADLLNAAEAAWNAGEKRKAFITLLGAMGLMSAGVAHREVEALKAKLPKE